MMKKENKYGLIFAGIHTFLHALAPIAIFTLSPVRGQEGALIATLFAFYFPFLIIIDFPFSLIFISINIYISNDYHFMFTYPILVLTFGNLYWYSIGNLLYRVINKVKKKRWK